MAKRRKYKKSKAGTAVSRGKAYYSGGRRRRRKSRSDNYSRLDRWEAKQRKEKKKKYPILTSRLKRWIGAVFMVVLGAVVLLSFPTLALSGTAGQSIFDNLNKLIGKTLYFAPVLMFVGAFLLLKPQKKRVLAPLFFALSFLAIGISGFLTIQNSSAENGGLVGRAAAWPFLKYFSVPVAMIVFTAAIVIGFLIIWEFMPKKKKDEKREEIKLKKDLPTVIKPVEIEKPKPKFRISPIELLQKKRDALLEMKEKSDAQKSHEMIGAAPAIGAAAEVSVLAIAKDYKAPPLSLFDTSVEKALGGDIGHNSAIIKKTLQNFGIEVEMAEANVGPTVTQYTLKPAEGIKLSKITGLNNDMALALAAHPIRIEAPIPGRALVGIEVPNKTRAVVKLGSLFAAPEYQKSAGSLMLALGNDVMGKSIFADLAGMPHLLVAGATGSGKTICLNSLIMSLICRNSPKILKFILIDPKRVEFPIYASLPHLLTSVIFTPQKAVNALNWLVGEMERRFDILKDFGSRDIGSYNKALQDSKKKQEDGFEVMPYIVLVIDELADLMMARGKEVEAAVVRISQLARAVGIHLIVATQRPSVEVITGLIKANITSRIAFQVASQIDSRTILDTAGADKLLGRGDMLYLSSEFSRPKRIQGSFIVSQEIKKAVKYIEKENSAEQREEMVDEDENEAVNLSQKAGHSEIAQDEPLYSDAKDVVVEYGKASASLLQRRLKIGYARAARILDILEQNGVVGPQEGARPRDVYIRAKDEKEQDGFHDVGDIEGEYK